MAQVARAVTQSHRPYKEVVSSRTFQRAVALLADFVSTNKLQEGGITVVTGAGASTASGIPDYRSPNGSYSKGHKPLLHQEYISSHASRQRYWARSMVGWKHMRDARPNSFHYSIAELQKAGMVNHIITQNVDSLHHKAGSSDVLEIHGALRMVECVSCNNTMARDHWQDLLEGMNERWTKTEADDGKLRADGDIDLLKGDFSSFRYPSCESCGGVMKPGVVFFGGSLKPRVRQESADVVDRSRALVIAGSTMQSYSAYSLAKRARERQLPIAIINRGDTRADALADLKVDGPLESIFPGLAALYSRENPFWQ